MATSGGRNGLISPLSRREFGKLGVTTNPHVLIEHIALPMKTTDHETLLHSLNARFEKNMPRHREMTWSKVQAKLEREPNALKALEAMETTGGEPDVVGYDGKAARFLFCDCSAESPLGRRSLCYDSAALEARKENKPRGSAEELAAVMGIDLLTEEQYRHLQTLGSFDLKTSSWIKTPQDVRDLGGALFCDRRYGKVFVYHNGAESYYAARGFRGYVEV